MYDVRIVIGENVTFGFDVVLGAKPLNLEFVPGTNYRRRKEYTGLITIGDNTDIGSACIIVGGGYRITKIGEHCWINHGAHMAHDVTIGDRTIIGNGAIILGEAEIGEDSYIAAGAIIHPTVKIGNRCMIGTGAIITKDVPDGTVIFKKGERIVKENKWYPPALETSF